MSTAVAPAAPPPPPPPPNPPKRPLPADKAEVALSKRQKKRVFERARKRRKDKLADLAAVQTDRLAAMQAFAARDKEAQALADRTAARALYFKARTQEALAAECALSNGADGAALAGVGSGSDVAVPSRLGDRSGIPGTPETEVPALAAQGGIGSGVPEDRPSGERVTAPVAVPFRERPLEERITRPLASRITRPGVVIPVIPLLPVGRARREKKEKKEEKDEDDKA
ncbi:hypothetical protein N7449_004651 [Penicillium cf. viridicatum]|uniref:Uncharacterized protein n=1 Tax=Penicillium cf. viridicatum TaxID=2972119 RepID=A0A9W9MJR8_9EURO|nr:hypothetical protein N7449_004651 [Penicillium cf. viridicatum]